ncbi:MAG: hypothetical protein EU549_01080, partial [Promethearchaeota archaeon]
MNLIEKKQNRYSLTKFKNILFDWIDQFKIENSNGFSVKLNSSENSLYGLCDVIYILKITNTFEEYFSTHKEIKKYEWVDLIQSFQDSKTGFFKEGIFNFGFHFKEHSSALATTALKLLDSEPKYEFKIKKKLNKRRAVEKWLRKKPEWGLLYWPGSHRGGGIGSIFATLGKNKYPHQDFFDWYFEWLDKKADPDVGFWRLGWIHKIRNRLTKNELGGAVHYYWIYEFFDHPFPYPEKIIDSTILLQNKFGTWDNEVSYCIDLDAIFCLTRSLKYANDYKKEKVEEALINYLDYVIPNMNNKQFLFSKYQTTHKLTGLVCAIAEIYKYHPDLF